MQSNLRSINFYENKNVINIRNLNLQLIFLLILTIPLPTLCFICLVLIYCTWNSKIQYQSFINKLETFYYKGLKNKLSDKEECVIEKQKINKRPFLYQNLHYKINSHSTNSPSSSYNQKLFHSGITSKLRNTVSHSETRQSLKVT